MPQMSQNESALFLHFALGEVMFKTETDQGDVFERDHYWH